MEEELVELPEAAWALSSEEALDQCGTGPSFDCQGIFEVENH